MSPSRPLPRFALAALTATLLGALLAVAPLHLAQAQTAVAPKADKPLATAPVPVRANDTVRTVAPLASPSGADSVRVLLVPMRETTVSSPVAGRIVRMESTLGAGFGAGRLLVGFDCDEPVARLGMAKAELAGAQETHEAKLRLKGLDQASDVEVGLAAAAAAKARAQIQLASAQVAQCNVNAPWAGRVSKIHARSHMSVAAGQPLLDLVMDGPLKLKLSVPSRWMAAIRPGVGFAVAIDETGKLYRASVTALNSRIDPVSQTIELEAEMAQKYPDLLAGMSGTARFDVAAP